MKVGESTKPHMLKESSEVYVILSGKGIMHINDEKHLLNQGDMRDLSRFDDESFDFIVHPCSNHCVDDILVVWKEAYRVLKKGGAMISGFMKTIGVGNIL